MKGSCLCGQVTYRISAEPRSIVACHCVQCRKSSGHYVAATQTLMEKLEISGAAGLTWYASSATAKRGFCKVCGSQLFWTEPGSGKISVMAGSIDGESGLTMDRQLYAGSKGDYYALPNVMTVDQSTL